MLSTGTWMNPSYPMYIISKGRWESRLTVKALTKMGVPYSIVVEKSEYDKYAKVIPAENILILPQKYLDEYDTCDKLGNSKSKGPGAARNFCWEHSIALGAERHWVLDDNLADFFRLNKGKRIRVFTGSCFRAAEDFTDRYTTAYIAGFNYYMMCVPRKTRPPYVLNTRIYSCLLIQNNIPYRWRGRYNEDTDLCLRVLKDGFCTIQFNAFLCGKIATHVMEGGNTEAFYDKEGTKAKSKMLMDLHPDVSEMVWRFNRHHHQVNYNIFLHNRLKKKKDLEIPEGVNNYGMILKTSLKIKFKAGGSHGLEL